MKRSISIGLVMLIPFFVFVSGCTKTPAEKRDAYVKSAAEYAKDGKYSEAAIQYENALKIAPDDVSSLMALGEVQLKRMKGADAYKAFYRATEADTKNTKAHVYLAYMQIMAKKYDMSEKEARAILAYDPKNREGKELLAQSLFYNGKQDDALQITRELLSDPKPSEANFTNSATMYLSLGKFDDALSIATRGASLYPGSARIKFLASDVCIAKGDVPQARKWAEEAYQADKKNINAGLALARFYAGQKMDDLFNSLIANLKTSFPKNPGPYLLESSYLQSKRDIDKAVAASEKAVALQDSSTNKTQLAQLLLEKGDIPKAQKLLIEAVDKDRNIIPARVLLAQIYLKQNNPQKALDTLNLLIKNIPTRPDVASETAQAYLMKGDLANARGFVERSLAENKNNVALHSMMVKIQFAQGNYKEALAEIDLLGKYALMQPEVMYAGTLSAFGLNQPAKGATYADTLKKLAPDSWPALHAQALAALTRKDRKGAYEAVDRAVSLYPQRLMALALYAEIAPSVITREQAISKISGLCAKNNTPECHLILSGLMEMSGNLDGSLGQLKEGVKMAPENASMAHSLAQFYLRHNMVKKAMDEYETLVNKNPNDIKAALMLAQINQGQGNLKDAKKVYTYIIERDPKNALAANNLAWILVDSGNTSDMAEALRLAQIAKDKFPEDPRISDTLGYVYLKKGLAENSLGQFKLALEKMPQDSTINYHMAMAMAQLNRMPEARKFLETALSSKQPFSDHDQAQKLLAKINSGTK